ncbi:MAG: serine hydrolase [Desulfobacterales bacterium]|jgi:CubicO group peptidase (beta-lactamase class C family)|nr:serine hydrolase [Desulfobacteraceae bacterium]MBT7085767.1 serine hydrolase [Desulfobacterales bacterium]MBT7697231.1 serine hydrolase [Desulfobacterales bacterium]
MKRLIHFSTIVILCAVLLSSHFPAYAQPELPTPGGTDPISLKLMQGFPTPPDKQITAANFFKFPNSRWTFHHLREFKPTKNIWSGSGAPSIFKRDIQNLGTIEFNDDKGNRTTIDEWQKNTFTDAMIVLHKGKIIYEKYYHAMQPEYQHVLFSVTKSFTGLLATQLIHEGNLNPTALVSRYIPELKDSAWGDATVQQTLDMTAAVAFTEVYTDPNSDIVGYAIASGMAPSPPGYTGPKGVTDFLKTLKKNGKHGLGFKYRTVNSEVIGWLVRRITGKSFAEIMSERIWQPIGAEEDAYVWVDTLGAELMGAGLNATLRDLARACEMLRRGGKFNGRQILAKEVVDEIRKGADRKKFKKGNDWRIGYSYNNQWWITHNAYGAYEALGVSGQTLHISPGAQMVVVKLSSHPVMSNRATHAFNTKAFEALAKKLSNKPH